MGNKENEAIVLSNKELPEIQTFSNSDGENAKLTDQDYIITNQENITMLPNEISIEIQQDSYSFEENDFAITNQEDVTALLRKQLSELQRDSNIMKENDVWCQGLNCKEEGASWNNTESKKKLDSYKHSNDKDGVIQISKENKRKKIQAMYKCSQCEFQNGKVSRVLRHLAQIHKDTSVLLCTA